MLLESEFMKAVQEGRTKDVENFLKNPDLNINYLHNPQNPNPNLPVPVSALHIAVLKSRTEIIKLLLKEQKFKKDAVTNFNRTALHLAAGLGQVENTEHLMAKVNCTIKDKNGNTAYDIAKNYTSAVDLEKRKKYEQIVELLKVPTFVQACRDGELSLVKKMVEQEGVDINAASFGSYGLELACLNGNYSVVSYLLSQSQTNVNIKNADDMTPLHSVVHPDAKQHNVENSQVDKFARYHITQELIKKGADVNARSKTYGATPLLHAVLSDAILVVQDLLKNKADLNFIYPKNDEEAKTQFWTADIFDFANNGKHDPEIIKLLNKAKQERGDSQAKKLVANSKGFQFSSDSASVTYSMENNNHATYELKI